MALCIFISLSCHDSDQPCVTCPTDHTNDTTSHAWTFALTRFGDPSVGSCSLYDVAIVNDSLAYAVGQAYGRDSLGQVDYQPYSLWIWQRGIWTMHKVPYYYMGQALYGPIFSVLAYGEGEVWFGIGNLIHWTGGQFVPVEVGNNMSGRINKMWGTSPSHFYAVGDNGSIALYDQGGWQKIAAGTSLNFYDIYGSGGLTLAVASNPSTGADRKIVLLEGNTAKPIPDNPIDVPLYSVWFVPNDKYYVAGYGIYESGAFDNAWTSDPIDSLKNAIGCIRGNSTNDVFAAGQTILHYNGKTWHDYSGQTSLQNGIFASVAVRGKLVIAVGSDGAYGVAAIGRR